MKIRVVLIFCLLFFYVFLLFPKLSDAFATKIDLNIDSDELGVTFLSLEHNKSLLFTTNSHDLMLLSYLDDQDLVNTLEMFGAYPLHALVYHGGLDIGISTQRIFSNFESYETRNIHIDKRENLTYLYLMNKTMCIYENGLNEDFSDCTFLYVLTVDHMLNIPDTVKLVIFDETINEDYLNIYEKWIDSYQLNNREFMTLKFHDYQYDMVLIPKSS